MLFKLKSVVGVPGVPVLICVSACRHRSDKKVSTISSANAAELRRQRATAPLATTAPFRGVTLRQAGVMVASAPRAPALPSAMLGRPAALKRPREPSPEPADIFNWDSLESPHSPLCYLSPAVAGGVRLADSPLSMAFTPLLSASDMTFMDDFSLDDIPDIYDAVFDGITCDPLRELAKPPRQPTPPLQLPLFEETPMCLSESTLDDVMPVPMEPVHVGVTVRKCTCGCWDVLYDSPAATAALTTPQPPASLFSYASRHAGSTMTFLSMPSSSTVSNVVDELRQLELVHVPTTWSLRRCDADSTTDVLPTFPVSDLIPSRTLFVHVHVDASSLCM